MGNSSSQHAKVPVHLESCVGLPYGEVLETLRKRKINIQLVAVKPDELYNRNNVQRPKFGVTVVYDCLTDIVKDIFVY
jgi:hypothetical protein